ncbi:hypothetical protein C2W62_27680 [Candidatus Entotheonella serta]|nr:hypothetical protein C2W62_27680 [Candidatus Entotheonella serta]
MSKGQATSAKRATQPLSRFRRVVYWLGRGFQGLGLLLIWWVLLMFAGAAGMWVLLYWSLLAALVFYVGWACTMWAKRDG